MIETVDIEIPFSGFYESFHDSQIKGVLEQELEDIESGEIDIDDSDILDIFEKAIAENILNYRAIFNWYAKQYTEAFSEENNLGLEFIELTSPKFYNFESDRIFAKISLSRINEIREECEQSPNWSEFIAEKCESRSGFMSLFSTDLADPKWSRTIWAEVQYKLLLEYWLNIDGKVWYEDYLEIPDFPTSLLDFVYSTLGT
jgi:hypothetical protein